jgi:hypothetical protein
LRRRNFMRLTMATPVPARDQPIFKRYAGFLAAT